MSVVDLASISFGRTQRWKIDCIWCQGDGWLLITDLWWMNSNESEWFPMNPNEWILINEWV